MRIPSFACLRAVRVAALFAWVLLATGCELPWRVQSGQVGGQGVELSVTSSPAESDASASEICDAPQPNTLLVGLPVIGSAAIDVRVHYTAPTAITATTACTFGR